MLGNFTAEYGSAQNWSVSYRSQLLQNLSRVELSAEDNLRSLNQSLSASLASVEQVAATSLSDLEGHIVSDLVHFQQSFELNATQLLNSTAQQIAALSQSLYGNCGHSFGACSFCSHVVFVFVLQMPS